MLNIIIVAIFFYKFSQNFASKNRFSQNYQVWLKINLIRYVSHPATRHWWELRAVHPTVADQNQHLKDTSYMRAGTWRHVIYRTWVQAMSANWTMLPAARKAPHQILSTTILSTPHAPLKPCEEKQWWLHCYAMLCPFFYMKAQTLLMVIITSNIDQATWAC